jgi:hypothetical protein
MNGIVDSGHIFHNSLQPFAVKAQSSKNLLEVALVDAIISFREVQFERSILLACDIAVSKCMQAFKSYQRIVCNHPIMV